MFYLLLDFRSAFLVKFQDQTLPEVERVFKIQ